MTKQDFINLGHSPERAQKLEETYQVLTSDYTVDPVTKYDRIKEVVTNNKL